jgi:hypothetical protein
VVFTRARWPVGAADPGPCLRAGARRDYTVSRPRAGRRSAVPVRR